MNGPFLARQTGGLLFSVALAAALAVATPDWAPSVANAQTAFPEKSLRLIIAFGPGGVADITSRLVAEKLADRLKQPVVVENNPGGGGIAAARTVIQAPADGHTLALLTNGTSVSAALFKALPFNPVTDFTPISKLGAFEFYYATGKSQPYKTLAEFVAAAKAAPGKLNVGSINPGSTQHLTALILKSAAGIDFQWVPFKTTPDLLVAQIRGDVQLIVDGYSAMKGNVDDGNIRLLAASSAQRSPINPNVPSAQEAGGGNIDVMSWNGLFVKAGTPPAVVARLNKEVVDLLGDKALQQKLLGVGIIAQPTTSAELGNFLKADIARWTKVIDDNKIERR